MTKPSTPPCKSNAIHAARALVAGGLESARALLWHAGAEDNVSSRALIGAVKVANARYGVGLRAVYGRNGLRWQDVVWGWTCGDYTYRDC